MARAPRFLGRSFTGYLIGQLGSHDSNQIKRALQEICKLYRFGCRFLPDQVYGMEQHAIGLLFSSDDAKVQRWSLNALAQFGAAGHCRRAILHALNSYHRDPEVLAAAIAALFRVSRRASEELRQLGLDEQMVTLAALQHVPADQLDLSSLPVNVENTDSELIKLGLLVVGLDKAPPHMFDPDYDNREIVRVLGLHDDPLVSQYSIWAITENSGLGVNDLGIDLKNTEQQPANVRAWIYQLLAMDFGRLGEIHRLHQTRDRGRQR